MIIEVRNGGFNLSQEDYLDEMARVYGVEKEMLSKIALSKEGASFTVQQTDVEPEETMIRASCGSVEGRGQTLRFLEHW